MRVLPRPQVDQSIMMLKRGQETQPQVDAPLLRMPKDKRIYFSEKILDFGQTQIGSLYRLKATICNPSDTKVDNR